VNPENGEIPEGIVSQTEQSLGNLQAILEAGRCTMKDVVEVSVFLKRYEQLCRDEQGV